MKQLRVAIIGQGRSGRNIHAHTMGLFPRLFKIVAVVDPIPLRRERAVQEMQCEALPDFRPLLKRKDLDLVVNATPSYLHAPYTLRLLRAGHNVLCEKPLAKTAREVDHLIAAARETGKVFAIYQQSRFAPYFLQVRKVIESGVLGRVVQISIAFNGFSRRWDWQTLTEFQGGNLLNTGPHPLDQALRFLDLPLDRTPEVFCSMDRAHFVGDAEGHVKLVMRAPGRPVIDLEISSCCAYPTHVYQVYGTQGGLKGSTTEMEWRYFDPAKAPKLGLIREPLANADGFPIYCGENLKFVSRKWAVPKAQTNLFDTIGGRFYKMLYRHVTKGAPFEVTPEQVRQQIAVIEECHRQNPHIWGKAAKSPRK